MSRRLLTALVVLAVSMVAVPPPVANATQPAAVTITYSAAFIGTGSFAGTAVMSGVFGSAVMPLFGDQSRKAKVSTLKTLFSLRSHITLLRVVSDEFPPGIRRTDFSIVVNGTATCDESRCIGTGTWVVETPPVPAGEPFLHGQGVWRAFFDDRGIQGVLEGTMHCDPC